MREIAVFHRRETGNPRATLKYEYANIIYRFGFKQTFYRISEIGSVGYRGLFVVIIYIYTDNHRYVSYSPY